MFRGGRPRCGRKGVRPGQVAKATFKRQTGFIRTGDRHAPIALRHACCRLWDCGGRRGREPTDRQRHTALGAEQLVSIRMDIGPDFGCVRSFQCVWMLRRPRAKGRVSQRGRLRAGALVRKGFRVADRRRDLPGRGAKAAVICLSLRPVAIRRISWPSIRRRKEHRGTSPIAPLACSPLSGSGVRPNRRRSLPRPLQPRCRQRPPPPLPGNDPQRQDGCRDDDSLPSRLDASSER